MMLFLSRWSRVLLLTPLLLAAPCRAQDTESESASLSTLSLSSDFYGSLIHNVSVQALVAAQRSVLGAAGPVPVSTVRRDGVTETFAADLTYLPSPGISRTLRQQIANGVAGSDPNQLPQLAGAMSSDSIWHWFDGLMRQSGLNARNLADVTAAYYVRAWEIVHHTDVPSSDSRAARDRIAGSLKRSPEIMFMSNAEKQRSAETFGILTTVSMSGSKSMREQNDASGFATLQTLIHETFLQQGVDLKRLSLDQYGFTSY